MASVFSLQPRGFVVRLLTVIAVLAVSPAAMLAQRPDNRSLFSATFGGMLFAHEYGSGFGFTITGSASVRVARPLMLGITVTEWGRLAGTGTPCGHTTRRCVLTGSAEVMSTFGLASIYPLRSRLLRGRLAVGFSYIRERIPAVRLQPEMIETRAWPVTVLIGLGSDIRISGQVFIAPTIDLLLVPSYEPRMLPVPSSVLFLGIGMTAG